MQLPGSKWFFSLYVHAMIYVQFIISVADRVP
jgi:hypothetical protein